MLVRLACLGVMNTFVVLRLLPVSDWDKDAEILALRLSSWCWSANSAQRRRGSFRATGRSR
ncbi:hypothetical protein OOK58_09540 [Streptomyces sp. NBC_01728]|uniref:hypothetical protein n=1 Tax=unclassified Streptomyces TaxID=2593676 RepID=UPI0022596D02|nr:MULTISPECIES: hypothetical protein [unclassified Streptomyces]MCX4452355.1 hypothetical protein [Streptomyces sp. NBC_01719]MCX4491715.1 hypothetical protein [Streptomyces sp. NBC_01728]